MFSINCKGKLLTFEEPIVMGILNATPDSFFEGHLMKGVNYLIQLAEKMIAEGASIIDIGGQSTQPYSDRITVEDELKRVIPVIEILQKKFPAIIISIDTYYSKVALEAVNAGASIVNDISAGNMDKNMVSIVADLNVPYVCMHMKGTPGNMQNNPTYNNIIEEISEFFEKKIKELESAGIKDIIIDPGFGFGKTIEQNFKMLHHLSAFKKMHNPILAGLSRKSTIYKTLQTTPQHALNGTTVLNTIALLNGVDILRVHDTKEAKEVITLINEYKKTVAEK